MKVPQLPLVAASTYDPRFDDAWLKWGRAYLESESLHAELVASHDNGHWRVTAYSEFNADANRFSIKVRTVTKPPDRWSLDLGEILHNYRSSLDAAAWAAVQRGTSFGTMTPEAKFNIGFPLNIDLNLNYMTTKSVEMIPGVTSADLAIFDWTQPYHVPEIDRRRDYLAYLTAQNNIDKHKNVRPIVLTGSDYLANCDDIETQDCKCIGVEVRKFNTLEIDTELARIRVTPIGPDPDIKVPGQVPVSVFLEEGIPLDKFLKQTPKWIESVLGGFSQKPPNLLQRLGF